MPKTFRKLTAEDIKKYNIKPAIKSEQVPVRFQFRGKTIDVETGETNSKGCNIIYQRFYWILNKPTAKLIAGLTGTKAVFDR